MIRFIRGTLASRDEGEVVVEAGGVGYQVMVSPNTSTGLGGPGDEVLVHTYHHIREEAQTLYGFRTPEERRVFEEVISVHGVGPALGLAILSVFGPLELSDILTRDDVDALCLVPGVGKKTATRLLMELKSRLDLGDVVAVGPSPVPADGPPDARNEVRLALAELGYTTEEIRGAIRSLPDGDDPSALLKAALRHMATSP